MIQVWGCGWGYHTQYTQQVSGNFRKTPSVGRQRTWYLGPSCAKTLFAHVNFQLHWSQGLGDAGGRMLGAQPRPLGGPGETGLWVYPPGEGQDLGAGGPGREMHLCRGFCNLEGTQKPAHPAGPFQQLL